MLIKANGELLAFKITACCWWSGRDIVSAVVSSSGRGSRRWPEASRVVDLHARRSGSRFGSPFDSARCRLVPQPPWQISPEPGDNGALPCGTRHGAASRGGLSTAGELQRRVVPKGACYGKRSFLFLEVIHRIIES